MQKEVFITDEAPRPGAYSQAIRWGNLVFVAGQTSEDPETGAPIKDSIAAQTERIFKAIAAILEVAGSSLDKIVRADVYLSSLAHKPEMDTVFRRLFPVAPPVRNTVGVSEIDDGLDVEIEVIAGVD